MNPNDAAWHDTTKPSFSDNGILVYSVAGSAPQVDGDLSLAMLPLIDEHKDIRFARFTPADDLRPKSLLKIRKDETQIDISSGFPAAKTVSDIVFSGLASLVDESSIAQQEKAIWQLCSALFDAVELPWREYTQGIPADQIESFTPRIRLDALGAFWSQLVAPTVQDGLKRARTAEEKALLHLTQNDLVAACEALVSGKCFKLATLVAQLPSTAQSRAMMKSQIEAWRGRNDWSEMSDPVRALYGILAGDVCLVEGKNGPSENRVADLNIAEKFGLSWRQSFALRLYFGGHPTIASAAQAYLKDLQANRERVQPTTTWGNGRETPDILMELLRLAANQPDVSQLFNPLVISGSGVHNRLTWQLALHLTTQSHCNLSDFELDQLTHAFATELEDVGHLVGSTWVLLHINDPTARQKAIIAQLNRHGDKILTTPKEDGQKSYFEQLTHDNQIPSKHVWRAKALWAKGGLDDSALQTEWLLRAGDIDDAHEVLCTTVGPEAVIERDYDGLSKLLQEFGGRKVDGWEEGGQVFVDFLKLVRAPPSKRHNADQEAAVQRLRKGLAVMEDEATMKTLQERVAVIEMSKVLHEHTDGEKDQEMTGADHITGGGAVEADLLRRYQQAMASA